MAFTCSFVTVLSWRVNLFASICKDFNWKWVKLYQSLARSTIWILLQRKSVRNKEKQNPDVNLNDIFITVPECITLSWVYSNYSTFESNILIMFSLRHPILDVVWKRQIANVFIWWCHAYLYKYSIRNLVQKEPVRIWKRNWTQKNE